MALRAPDINEILTQHVGAEFAITAFDLAREAAVAAKEEELIAGFVKEGLTKEEATAKAAEQAQSEASKKYQKSARSAALMMSWQASSASDVFAISSARNALGRLVIDCLATSVFNPRYLADNINPLVPKTDSQLKTFSPTLLQTLRIYGRQANQPMSPSSSMEAKAISRSLVMPSPMAIGSLPGTRQPPKSIIPQLSSR